jgi:hypothetical protein
VGIVHAGVCALAFGKATTAAPMVDSRKTESKTAWILVEMGFIQNSPILLNLSPL